MMLEGGFARTREVSNIMIECIVDTALCGILFYAFGFAFMFGPGNGWIGYHYFFLQGIPHTYTYGGLFDTGVAFLAFFLFQFAFADTASTIVSGAMVGRTALRGRPDLQRRRQRVHLPDLRPLGLGSRRLARQGRRRRHGRPRRSVTSPARPWSTPSAVCSPSAGRSRSGRASAASSSVTAVGCRQVTT